MILQGFISAKLAITKMLQFQSDLELFVYFSNFYFIFIFIRVTKNNE